MNTKKKLEAILVILAISVFFVSVMSAVNPAPAPGPAEGANVTINETNGRSILQPNTGVNFTILFNTTNISASMFYINVTVETGYENDIDVNGTGTLNDTISQNGTFYINGTGDVKFNVNVSNSGNSSEYANITGFVFDGTPPVVTIDTPTESSKVYRKGGAQFYVNCTYTESNPANYTVEIRNGTDVINTTTVNYPSGGTDQVANRSFNLNTTAADGEYNVTVTMYDNVSLSYIAYQNNSVVKDDTSPSVVIDTPTESSKVYRKGGEQFYVNFTYTELNPANYTVEIRNGSTVINDSTNESVVGGTDRFANVSFNLNTSAADGEYNVTVTMYDNASNYIVSYQNYSVVKDGTAPGVVIDTPTVTSKVYRKGGEQFYVNFTYTELNPANYTVEIRNSSTVINDSTNESVVGGTDRFANVSFYLNTSAADGQYNVTVTMYDNVSLSSTVYQNYSVVKDGTAPGVVIDTPTVTSKVYRKGGAQFYVNFTYTELNPDNYTVEIRNSSTVINDSTNESVVGGDNQVANVSFYLNSSAADGQYNVTVTMYDNVSLSSTVYQNYSVVKDGTAPGVVIDTPTVTSKVYRKGGAQFYVNFTYTELNPANYTVTISNSTATINTSGVKTPAGGIINESFYLNPTAAEGEYNVTATMYDNVSLSNVSYRNNSVVKDDLPTVTSVSPEDEYTGVAITTTISATFSEAMNTTSVEDAFSISPIVEGHKIWEGNKMVFYPGTNLAYSTTYTVTINASIAKDLNETENFLDGNADGTADGSPTDDYIWAFTTESALIHRLRRIGGRATPPLKPGETLVSSEPTGEVKSTVAAFSADGKAVAIIFRGTIAKDAAGNPLTKVTVIPPSILPAAVPSGANYVGYYAYDFGPEGATFSKLVEIFITFDPAKFPAGTTPVIYTYEAGAWKALDTTFVGNKATTKVTHSFTFVLFAAPKVTVTPTPIPTATPTVSPTATPTPTPTPKPGIPAFEAVFTIAGLLVVAYLVLRRKTK